MMYIHYDMTNKNKNRQFKEVINFIIDMLKECKIKTIILSLVIVIAFLTGIIVAARTHTSFASIDGYGIIDVKTGTLTTSFFTRLFSMLFVALILLGCSFFNFLLPIAVLFLAYRTYLLGLNICLMIVLYGFSGVIATILIALPCQLLAIILLGLFYLLMSKTIGDYKCYGGTKIPKQKVILITYTLILIFAICLIESILLTLFSAKVILII